MGKAMIVGGGDDGLYTIERIYNDTVYQQQKAMLEGQITGADERIAELDSEINEAEGEASEAYSNVQAAQDDYVQAVRDGEGIGDAKTLLDGAMSVWSALQGRLQGLRTNRQVQVGSRLSAQKRLHMLESAQPPGLEQAWCADHVEDASGEVETIEAPGEPQRPLVIAPQHPDGAGSGPGGKLQPREWMAPAQAYVNAALLPGWQYWRPTYRVGTISDIDGNTCTVRLDPEQSTAQGLPVNQQSVLVDVPIDYMDCDGEAFEDDDRVVVRFKNQSWASPVVVGFVSEPRECELPLFALWEVSTASDPSTENVAAFDGNTLDGFACYTCCFDGPQTDEQWPGTRQNRWRLTIGENVDQPFLLLFEMQEDEFYSMVSEAEDFGYVEPSATRSLLDQEYTREQEEHYRDFQIVPMDSSLRVSATVLGKRNPETDPDASCGDFSTDIVAWSFRTDERDVRLREEEQEVDVVAVGRMGSPSPHEYTPSPGVVMASESSSAEEIVFKTISLGEIGPIYGREDNGQRPVYTVKAIADVVTLQRPVGARQYLVLELERED